MSNKDVKPVSRRADIVVQNLEKEILVYDLAENRAFSLNETSAMVWQICDGTKSVSQIAQILSKHFHSTVSEDFVWLALEQLKEENLLENPIEITPNFSGLSRREVIRKVGFASLVALPFVASLVAPRSAQAISLAGNGTSCTANGQCTSGCCGATAAGAANQSCVAVGIDATGSYCRAGCECASVCCVNNACQPGNIAVNGPCTTACQCASKSCNTIANTCN